MTPTVIPGRANGPREARPLVRTRNPDVVELLWIPGPREGRVPE
ncbi:MAG: hypothetical protein QOD11_1732 [Bradyrhizobium sp.]|nr:hypothetical protein [Bradyrhizobium sp.]